MSSYPSQRAVSTFIFKLIMNRIKEVLTEQGRSQAWLADKLDMSYMTVTRYCNNKRQPTIDTLNKIAELLEVDNRDLLVPLKPDGN